jgi:hypothetical protein
LQPVAIPDYESAAGPFFVIRTQRDWEDYCTGITPLPDPPVNFQTSMILAYSWLYSTTCIDWVDFKQVCYFDDRIELSYDFRNGNYDSNCEPVVCALLFIPTHLTVAVEIPQSSLPVSWVKNDFCPGH